MHVLCWHISDNICSLYFHFHTSRQNRYMYKYYSAVCNPVMIMMANYNVHSQCIANLPVIQQYSMTVQGKIGFYSYANLNKYMTLYGCLFCKSYLFIQHFLYTRKFLLPNCLWFTDICIPPTSSATYRCFCVPTGPEQLTTHSSGAKKNMFINFIIVGSCDRRNSTEYFKIHVLEIIIFHAEVKVFFINGWTNPFVSTEWLSLLYACIVLLHYNFFVNIFLAYDVCFCCSNELLFVSNRKTQTW